MRLKGRLSIAFVCLAVLPLLGAGIMLMRPVYQGTYLLQLALQRQEAYLAAAKVSAHVDTLLHDLMLTAQVKGLEHLDAQAQQHMLEELLAWQSQFFDLAWLDASGRERARVSSLEVVTRADLRSRAETDEYREPKAKRTVWFGPIAVDSETAEPLMAVAVPTFNPRDGQLIGVLVARLRLKRMWEVVSQVATEGKDNLYIADLDGLVVAHPNPSVVLRGTRVTLPTSDGLHLGMDGREVIAAQTRLVIGAREFVAVSEEPVEEALALALHTAITTASILAVALVAALAMVWLAGRRILQPIQRLGDVVGAISSGDLARRADCHDGDDEIKELASAFNSMTARLQNSVETLESHVIDRTRDLSEAQSRLVDAIESVSEGFVLCDSEDRFVMCNRKFRDFYPEVAHLAVPGRPFREVIVASAKLGLTTDAEDSPGWVDRRLAMRLNMHPHVQRLSSGRWLLVSERRTASGQMTGIYTDITELKEVEEALRTAKAQAESAAKAKSDFLAAMSHELRTPLNAVIGFSDTILTGVFGQLENPRYRDYINDIHRSGLHLLSLINDILDLSKIEAGRMEIERIPVDLAEVIDRALGMTRDAATANHLSIALDMDPDLPLVGGDERRLLQVMLNLMSNAVKFTPPKGCITVSAWREEKQVVVQVADTGIGIADRDLARALEPFGQIDSTHSRRFPGTGLGLPLSRQLVTLHGGELSIQSAVGKGTIVTVRLLASP